MSLTNYCLHLADDNLIMGHRLSEWTGHGPMLEQDIAISNIALDLIGQSRNFYQYAAEIINSGKDGSIENPETEDTLAYLREAKDFKNIILTELPNGDWAETILKLFFFSTYQYYLYRQLFNSADTQLSAIAEKSLKEVTYHVRWSSEWVIRLGDGTEESKQRMENAINKLWDYTSEMFNATGYEIDCAGNKIGVDVSSLKVEWNNKVDEVFRNAKLKLPEYKGVEYSGKQGLHSDHLGNILSEMQFLQRTYPGAQW